VLLNLGNGAIYTAIKKIRDFLLKGLMFIATQLHKKFMLEDMKLEISLVIFDFTLLIIIPLTMATDPEIQVRFPALPDFLIGGGSGTGSTQPCEYNSGPTSKK
jgi:hypothetical protein